MQNYSEIRRVGERERKILQLLVYSLNGCQGRGSARPNPEVFLGLHMNTEAHRLEPCAAALQITLAGSPIGSEPWDSNGAHLGCWHLTWRFSLLYHSAGEKETTTQSCIVIVREPSGRNGRRVTSVFSHLGLLAL